MLTNIIYLFLYTALRSGSIVTNEVKPRRAIAYKLNSGSSDYHTGLGKSLFDWQQVYLFNEKVS